jgi:hypothetical protein
MKTLIRKLPYYIDFLDKPKGLLSENGYANIETDHEIKNLIKSIFNYSNFDNESKGLNQNIIKPKREILKKLINKIERDSGNILKKYLGYYSIDICYEHISIFKKQIHRDSQLWHHDSVGRRIKIFLNMEESCNSGTLFETGSHKISNIYKINIPKEERLSYKPKNKIIELTPTINNICLFDTNSMHKGVNGEPGEKRHLIVIELSNPLKSLTRGKVGKRNRL